MLKIVARSVIPTTLVEIEFKLRFAQKIIICKVSTDTIMEIFRLCLSKLPELRMKGCRKLQVTAFVHMWLFQILNCNSGS